MLCLTWGLWAFPSCGVWASLVPQGFNCPSESRILAPWPRLEPTSPTLESRFLITGPSRKSPFIGFSDLSGNLTLLAWKDQGCSQVQEAWLSMLAADEETGWGCWPECLHTGSLWHVGFWQRDGCLPRRKEGRNECPQPLQRPGPGHTVVLLPRYLLVHQSSFKERRNELYRLMGESDRLCCHA